MATMPGKFNPPSASAAGSAAIYCGEAAECRDERRCYRPDVTARLRGEQDDFKQLVIRQALGPVGEYAFPKALAMAEIVPPDGRLGKLSAVAVGRRRERLGSVRAVNLAAERPYALAIAGIEQPYAPRTIPLSAEHPRSRWEIGMARGTDRKATPQFHDRDRHPIPRIPNAEHRASQSRRPIGVGWRWARGLYCRNAQACC
jgi:hypothetical protein